MTAGSTYEPIATQTLGSNQISVTFSSIPSTYTDLVFVVQAQSNVTGSSSNGMRCRLNGDTGTNYSYTQVYGDGTSTGSARESTVDYFIPSDVPQVSATERNICIFHIMNYSNTTTYKTILSRGNIASSGTSARVGLWRSTAAVNSVTIGRDLSSQSLITGSIFTVYGIKAA